MYNNEEITFFLPSFGGGGVEKMMIFLANDFAKKGIKVTYVVGKSEGPYENLLLPEIEVIDLKLNRVLFAIFPLIRLFRKRGTRIVLTAMNYVNIIVLIASFFSKKLDRVIIGERTIPSLCNSGGISFQLVKFGIKKLYPKATNVIAISEGVKTDLIDNFDIEEDKIKIINNFYVINNENKKTSKNRLYDKLKKSENPIIIAVGRLVKEKNFTFLIKVFAKLSIDNEVKLLILGEGEERAKLEHLVGELGLSNRVILPGLLLTLMII